MATELPVYHGYKSIRRSADEQVAVRETISHLQSGLCGGGRMMSDLLPGFLQFLHMRSTGPLTPPGTAAVVKDISLWATYDFRSTASAT
jgi:hypothetical protein